MGKRNKLYNILARIICIMTLQVLSSCTQSGDKQPNKLPEQSLNTPKADIQAINDTAEIEMLTSAPDTSIEVMSENDILYNGKFKRYFSLNTFYSLLGQPDSIKFLGEENPCTTIFEHPDGTIAPEAKYLYKHGTRFENSGDEVALDKVYFNKGNSITFKKKF